MANQETISQLKRKKEIAGNFMSFFPAGMVILVLLLENVGIINGLSWGLGIFLIVLMFIPMIAYIRYAKLLKTARQDKTILDS